VELSDNFLTRFEEGVFKSMLEDMLVGGGSLDVGGSRDIFNYFIGW